LLVNAPISLIGTYAVVDPVVAVFFGTLFSSELITGALIFEDSLVIAGIVLVVLGERNTPQRN
jgi:drug/metabolite transporter (DMT)-like permease